LKIRVLGARSLTTERPKDIVWMDTIAPSPPHADDLRKRQRRQRVADDVARSVVVCVIAFSMLLLLLPLALTVSMSFDARDYLGVFPPPALSTRWYAKFFSDPYLLNGLKTSLQLAALTAVAATALGLSAAVALERLPRRFSQPLMAVFLSPLIVPGVVIGFALLIFYARIGVENTFLRLLAGHVLITFPYAIRTVLAALGGIRPSLVEVAQSLGASPVKAFWTVTFPLARTGVAAGAIFAFVFSLDDVAVSIFLSDPHRYTLPVALVSMLHANFDLTIAAVAVLIIGASIGLMLLLDWMVGLDRVVGAGYYRT
jgi:putative spermidine/putrescine transport system permease protein